VWKLNACENLSLIVANFSSSIARQEQQILRTWENSSKAEDMDTEDGSLRPSDSSARMSEQLEDPASRTSSSPEPSAQAACPSKSLHLFICSS
jgi:hypothetical protein